MASSDQKLRPEDLAAFLIADLEEGTLVWKERRPDQFRKGAGKFSAERSAKIFNSQFAGKEAFTALDAAGYRVGRINHQAVKAHRVIWAMAHGAWPDGEIDHINGDPADNRICNLRICTSSQNKMNQGLRRNKRSRYRGVSFSRAAMKWAATIQAGGKRKHIGLFESEEDAAKAYDAAAQSLHGSFSRTNEGRLVCDG